MTHYLKNYFIYGNITYLITVLISGYLSMKYYDSGEEYPYLISPITIFYSGLLLEIIVFSLGMTEKIRLEFVGRMEGEVQLKNLKNKQNIILKELIIKRENELSKIIHEQKEKEKEQMKIAFESELSSLKVNALRNQMNPHFIFNSLNSIKLFIINNEKENAVYYLNKFSKLIRLILLGTHKKINILKEELDFIDLYFKIENLRFDNSLVLKKILDDNLDLNQIKIPALLLQPFIENSIWHGLSNKKGEKWISIEVSYCTSCVKILVIDNGIGLEKSKVFKDAKLISSPSIGLGLTKKRLDFFSQNFENKGSIRVETIQEDFVVLGTKVECIIPIK